ncbi:MAG: thermonuclease family protein [Myxococcota bacterium]
MELSPTAAFRLLIASMLMLSVYFTVDVELRRYALQGDATGLALEDGATVQIEQPIDGDELAMRLGDAAFTLRLLGVKAFDVTNEPGLGNPGQRAVDQLARLNGRSGTVRSDGTTLDRNDRLIAALDVDGEDVGAALVREGWAVVYTKYPFPDLDAYLALEAEARAEHRGLWSSPKATERAQLMRASWEADE